MSSGKEIVTKWLLDLWINRPSRLAQPGGDWLNRMPQQQEVEALIKDIDQELAYRDAALEMEIRG